MSDAFVPVSTDAAPAAIGPYSQAVVVGDLVFLSGQIPLDPSTMEMVEGIEAQIERVLDNLDAVTRAAGGDLARVVKFNVFLVDLAHFGLVNSAMEARLAEPYPARAAVQVAALPRGAQVEIEAIMRR